ncbi:MAG: HlyD family type I secretion periplasmic adaptor subunit [Pseudomonadota bacterium]
MTGDDTRWKLKGPVLTGVIALVVLVVGLGGWSATTSLAGAVIAPGIIEVEGNRQAVQHLDGGVVGEILVEEGAFVDAGDVVLRFDGTLLRSELAIVEGQLFEILARKGRLIAERDGADTIRFADELMQPEAVEPFTLELRQGQERLFEARRVTLEKQVSQLVERREQIGAQIDGTLAQIDALEVQSTLIAEEQADQQSLLDRGLTQQSRVLSLMRESARLKGQLGDLQARVAQSRGQISEIEIEAVRLESDLREQAITQLRDLEFRELELRERRLSTLETLSRLDVRAPVSGVVYDRRINALRSVVRPADVMMFIVPRGEALVIASRIEPIHIDQITVGQRAMLRFPAFNQRTTPELEGLVTKVSPDAFVDETTGASYYTAELLPADDQIDKLEGLELLPGMPVEAFILTGERTPLSFLVKPMADYFERAFRES